MTDDTGHRTLLAILSADVVGYSRLMQSDERDTVNMLTECRTIFTTHVEARRGRIVDALGDNILAAFESPVEAVTAAIAIQREIGRQNSERPEERRMRFRIGINVGDVLVRDDALYGDGVNVAARLESLSDPDSVLISESVHGLVEGKFHDTFEFAGEHEVKNITTPIRAWRLAGSDTTRPQRTPRSSPKATSKPSIAVLAFENMSTDPEQEYFSDGIAEDLITELSKLSGLSVIARNSSFVFKGRNVDLREVGRDLGVRYVLEGSVRKAGSRVRVNAQLIDSETGSHLWAERYDRDLADIFAVQDEVTGEIVRALSVRLSRDEKRRSRSRHSADAEAYDYFLRARSYPISATGRAAARALTERAIAVDPDFADAHADLAHHLINESEFGVAPSHETIQLAIRSAETAIKLDPDSSSAHYALAKLKLFEDDRDGFAAAAKTALELSPNSAILLADIGRLYAHALGQLSEGAALARRAIALNPYHPGWYSWALMIEAVHTDDYATAVELLKSIDEPRVYCLSYGSMIYAAVGDHERSERAREDLLRDYPGYNWEWAYKHSHVHPDLRGRYIDLAKLANLPLTAAPETTSDR